MIIAQAIGEYGALGSMLAAPQQLAYDVADWLGSLSPTTWVVAAAVVLAFVFLKRR
jgi:hypothetical protein